MADVLFLVITGVFFAIAVAAVRLCDRVIGPDAEHLHTADPVEADAEPVGAPR